MKDKTKLAKVLLTDEQVCLNCGSSDFDSGLPVSRLHCEYIHEDVYVYESCIGWSWDKKKK